MTAADDRVRQRLISRLNRRPMPVKWQLAVFVILAALAVVIGSFGWMCRQ